MYSDRFSVAITVRECTSNFGFPPFGLLAHIMISCSPQFPHMLCLNTEGKEPTKRVDVAGISNNNWGDAKPDGCSINGVYGGIRVGQEGNQFFS